LAISSFRILKRRGKPKPFAAFEKGRWRTSGLLLAPA
jgi:hypothetical protein